jgi:hypothetical protein
MRRPVQGESAGLRCPCGPRPQRLELPVGQLEQLARAGGFTSRAHYEPGARALGHTQLTVDHFEMDAG